jgi:ATP/maltotriose-dependent transcriptional regulator MalT
MTTKQKRIRVRFAVDDDEQASKIIALLEALGFAPVRDLEEGSPSNRLRWAVSRLAGQARLTERERDILDRVLQGASNREISDTLEISKATVKWHMHNIFTKTGSRTREALLRDALQLRTSPESVEPIDETSDDE